MRQLRASLIVVAASTFVTGFARATDISPTVLASIRDAPMDGLGDTFTASPFHGLLSKGSPAQEDRAIQEFDVAAFTSSTLQSATLSGRVSVNNSFDVGVRTFDFRLYAGNGTADLSDFQIAATLVGSGSYYPPTPPFFTYSFDVTAVAQTLLSGGATWIGLKVVCTSDPNYPNILDDTTSRLAIVAVTTTGGPFCPGDGTGTLCPCSNHSPIGSASGCLSSLAVGGKLVGSGQASVLNDSFRLDGTNLPNSSALYFQGTVQVGTGAGAIFGDGLRCVSGTVRRLGVKTSVAGASHYPDAGDPPISVQGTIPALGGTLNYQAWYRNAAAFCLPATFNLTNGWRVVWTP